jgi:hypothetical protein
VSHLSIRRSNEVSSALRLMCDVRDGAKSGHPHLAIGHLPWADPPVGPNQLLNDWPLSLGKRGPEHRQTASRLLFGRLILQNIPVFREHAVGHPDDIGGDPISGPSSSRKPAMDDHVIVFSNDQARLVLQRRWRAPNQIEQAVAPRRDVRAVLNVVR